MNISDLKENDVVHSNWFVNWPVLVCKFQPGLNGLRLVPKNYMDHAETERNRRVACPTVDLLERTDWTLIGSYDPVKEVFEWKKFQVQLTRRETGLGWRYPTIFNSFKDAEDKARYWDRFYKNVENETSVGIWKADLVML